MYLIDWKMTYENHKDLPCKAPCTMYSVLLENGIIDNPFYGLNEAELTKLSEKGCVFECDFEVDEAILSKEYVELSFLGLDTICTIFVNGKLIDNVKNMHRMYRYDVKETLHKGTNKVKLEFSSPVEYFKNMNNKHYLFTNSESIEGAAHLRKALYMSGWDWGVSQT